LPKKRLDSWKEIAVYVGRDERTALRWAKERGMPVHHVPGPGRGTVFAYTDQIDAWLNQQPAEETEARAAAGVEPPAAHPGKLWRIVLPVAAVLLVALLVVVGMRSPNSHRPGLPERIQLSRTKVQAVDAAGQQVWEYSLPEPVRFYSPADQEGLENLARVVDLDGDGSPEVLVTARLEKMGEVSRSVLHCFTAEGELRWKYDPDVTLSFAGRPFGGPWNIADVLAAPEGKGHAIWLAVAHYTWWPAFVVKLDAAGKAEVRFVNSGTLKILNFVRTADTTYILVGGFNNEQDGGILAVLPAGKPAGTSPQKPGSPYRCDACPPGEPVRYLVFPRSELNQTNPNMVNHVAAIGVTQKSIQVLTREGPEGVFAYYDFSLDPEPQLLSVTFSDPYWRWHKQLEEEGKIKHTQEQCPERDGPRGVRVWEPGSGWREMRPADKKR